MHETSLANMKKMMDRILTEDFLVEKRTILDYGARIVSDHLSYRSLLKDKTNINYIGLDIEPGNGVDIIMTDIYKAPLEDNSVDVILSGQMFEHCEFFWLTINDMARILKKGGYIFLIAPSSGCVHRYPVDCWRFYPDAYKALAKWSNPKLELIDSWQDEEGYWKDQVGMFKKL